MRAKFTTIVSRRGFRSSPVVAALSLAVALGVTGSMTGCRSSGSSAQTGGTGSGTASASGTSASVGRADYFAAFEEGRYRDAFDSASAAAGRYAPGLAKEQAQLIAGLSAQALNRGSEAVPYLEPLLSSTDPVIVGKANAGLGLVQQSRGRHNEAINHLLAAGEALQGDDAARSLLYAGDSYRAIGQLGAATDVYAKAQSKVESDANLRAMLAQRVRGGYVVQPNGQSGAIVSVQQRTSSGVAGGSSASVIGRQNAVNSNVPYTVQLGAFSSPTTARQEAGKVRGIPARVVPTVDRSGKTLYAVRVGTFGSIAQAEQIRTQLGGRGVVMRAANE